MAWVCGFDVESTVLPRSKMFKYDDSHKTNEQFPPRSIVVPTIIMKLLAVLLVGSAAAFAPSQPSSSRASVQVAETKVRKAMNGLLFVGVIAGAAVNNKN
jgi:hypothetical protein